VFDAVFIIPMAGEDKAVGGVLGVLTLAGEPKVSSLRTEATANAGGQDGDRG